MRVAATALALAMASSGCAVIAAKGPDPDRPIAEIPQCNAGKGGVAVDTVVALLIGVSALAVGHDEPGPGLLLGLTGGVYGLSAAAGNSSANTCRRAMDRYDEYIARERAAPAGLGGLATAPTPPTAPTASRRWARPYWGTASCSARAARARTSRSPAAAWRRT
jgi:hypothetical protein